MNVYVNRIRRYLTCHIASMSKEQGDELKKLIDEKVKANAKKAKTQSDGGERDQGAA